MVSPYPIPICSDCQLKGYCGTINTKARNSKALADHEVICLFSKNIYVKQEQEYKAYVGGKLELGLEDDSINPLQGDELLTRTVKLPEINNNKAGWSKRSP